MRDFAVPLKRTGNLRRDAGNGLPIDVGAELHAQIQGRLMGENKDYQAEVSLLGTVRGRHYELKIRGRCDGIASGLLPQLEEIKTSFNLANLKQALDKDPEHPYILQLKTYGWIYLQNRGVVPDLSLRLVDSRTRREELLSIAYDEDSFQIWMERRVAQIEEELLRAKKLREQRRKLGAKLEFPFLNPRPQQKELVEAVTNSLQKNRPLLLQAPTGLGKTAGVLYPALKYALAKGAPVLYIAPKNSQFKAAIDCAKVFQKKKIGLKVLVITSKAKACHIDAELCQASACPLTIDYYDRRDASGLAKRDTKKHLWDLKYFQSLAEKTELCPYELGMEKVPEADLIICDYNYVFSPHANFFDRYMDPIVPRKKPVLVIDESHNLYERVMENYSPEIRLSQLQNFLENAKTSKDGDFIALVQKAIALMAELRSHQLQAKVSIKLEAIQSLLEETVSNILSGWGQEGLPQLSDPLMQFYLLWLALYDVVALEDPAIPILYKREAGDEILRAQCLDPHAILAPIYAQFEGVVAFSATLKPFDFYRHMSGFVEGACDTEEFLSPFPRENKKILLIPQVETSYRERDRHYERIAEIIMRIASQKKGPYLVFFSSYSFLKEVESKLSKDRNWELVTQMGSMSESGIRSLMRRIQEEVKPLLLLAVQGGSLSEGIDFKGAGFQGVFIVGPAVPTASFERRLMQEYLDGRELNGRAYAYVYPAMTKSVQAAGRIVRDEEERGVIVLMDPRFLEADFQKAMPHDWFLQDAKELVSQAILSDVKEFWEKEKPSVHENEG